MKHLITYCLIGIFTTACVATTVTIEADNFTHLENMSNPLPNIRVFGTDIGWDLSGNLPLPQNHLFPAVAYASSITDNPLGTNVIGNPIATPPPEYNLEPWEYWYDSVNFLFIEIDGLLKDITVHSANRPGYTIKSFVIDLYTPDGVRVGHNFSTGTVLTSNLVDYSAKYALIYTSGYRSFDNIGITYIIPEPATVLLFAFALLFLPRTQRRV